MPQQVNLYLPILRKRKESFTAQTLAQALLILIIGGGALSAAWVWSLQGASASLQQTLDAQDQELTGLRTALEATHASAGPVQATLTQELAKHRDALQKRQSVLDALGQGVLQVGQGHAARLRLVAQTIPTVAWVNAIKADSDLLEVSGFTLAPEALNGWLAQLAANPLLQGQTLSAVKVEEVVPSQETTATPRWTFHIVSRIAFVAGEGRT